MEMAEDPAVVDEVVMGVDPKTGKPIVGKQVNEHVKEMHNLIKTEDNIHSSLLATRKAKAAAGKSIKEQEQDYLDEAAVFADEIEADFEVRDGSNNGDGPSEDRDQKPEGSGEDDKLRGGEHSGDAKPGDEGREDKHPNPGRDGNVE